MIRKIIKNIYLNLIKILNIIFMFKSVKRNQIVVYVSFLEDLEPIISKLIKSNFNVIMFYHPRISEEVNNINVKKYRQSNKNLMIEMYYLSSSKWIIVDTYYLILGGLLKKNGQKVIQTWHAVGALKRFGLEEKKVQQMDNKAINQYKKVYNSYDYILAGSNVMGEIFIKSFGIDEERLLYIGLPRMDKYFEINKDEYISFLKQKYNIERSKKVVTYLPTFRDYELNDFNPPIDFKELNREWLHLVKLHPATKSEKLVSTNIPTSDLIYISDVIVTDYSSLAMEASILNKTILFYPYDYETYDDKRGLIENYFDIIGENYFLKNKELMNFINDNNFKESDFIKKSWNKYNDGNSTHNLIDFIKRSN